MNKTLSAIIGFIGTLPNVPGLQSYIEDNIQTARSVVNDLAKVNGTADFHHWKDQALTEFARLAGRGESEWQSLVIHLAFEELKALSGSNWFTRLWAKVTGFITRNGLLPFVQKYTLRLTDFLQPLYDGKTNADVAEARAYAWDVLKRQSQEVKGTWIRIVADIALSVLKARGVLPSSLS